MRKTIVTTTINPPSKAIKLFAEKKDWDLVIIGDKKTPHDLFRGLEKKYKNVSYFSPDDQDKKYPKLSKSLGWGLIQRRNIGYVEAYLNGADIIATIDDDNIPFENWGENIILGKKVKVNYYKSKALAFDPVGATNYPHLWHRGFPIQLLSKRDYSHMESKEMVADVQADFWNGDPDIDAICRMEHAPDCKFDNKYFPMASNRISPFNSQNTFISRKVIKDYFLFNEVGRMDDIWASYYVQSLGYKVVYTEPTVSQARNDHDLTIDMKKEFIGYENNMKLIESLNEDSNNILNFLPSKSTESFEIYLNYFK